MTAAGIKMKTITKILGVGILGLIGLTGCDNHDTPEDYNTDFNGDGKIDIIEKIGENRHRYFINLGNNEYQEVTLRIVDGMPFFRAEKGYFSPWGQYLSDNGKITDLKNHKF